MSAQPLADKYVEVVSIADLQIVRRLGPMSDWKAEKVERGLLINMNREAYFTRVVSEPKATAP